MLGASVEPNVKTNMGVRQADPNRQNTDKIMISWGQPVGVALSTAAPSPCGGQCWRGGLATCPANMVCCPRAWCVVLEPNVHNAEGEDIAQ